MRGYSPVKCIDQSTGTPRAFSTAGGKQRLTKRNAAFSVSLEPLRSLRTTAQTHAVNAPMTVLQSELTNVNFNVILTVCAARSTSFSHSTDFSTSTTLTAIPSVKTQKLAQLNRPLTFNIKCDYRVH